ncbi:MAG: hypothetical protein LBG62_06095 [Candidatus Methanoplasma sp.]|jgi:hypothetical protein|nr:hypothetical protein [Candidatus Methanoplasma sp.]
MMEGRPMKFRLLEVFGEGERWNCEVIPEMQREYGMGDRYGADTINFDIIEMATCGFLSRIDVKVDSEGLYREGSLLIRYRITDLGRAQLEKIGKNLRKKGARA